MMNLLGKSTAMAQTAATTAGQAGSVSAAQPASAAAASTAVAGAQSGGATAAQNATNLNHLPHGIRGLAEYPLLVIPMWLVATLALLLIAAMAIGLRYWWKKRHPHVVVEKIVHPLDRLRAEVERLVPTEPFVGRVPEDYFYNLSMALRRFIEELLKIPATDRTLKELREPLRLRLPLSRERVAELLGFLERADMIKFAQAETSLEEARRCHDDVKLWIAYLLPRELDQMTATSDQASPQNPQLKEVAHRT